MVSSAAFSWACFSLFAIVCLNLVILIFSSSPNLIFLSEGAGLTDIRFIKSPLDILPSFPVPVTELISIFFSAIIFLTDGERLLLILVSVVLISFVISLVKINGCSPFTSLSIFSLSSISIGSSFSKIFGCIFSGSSLLILFFSSLFTVSFISTSSFFKL